MKYIYTNRSKKSQNLLIEGNTHRHIYLLPNETIILDEPLLSKYVPTLSLYELPEELDQNVIEEDIEEEFEEEKLEKEESEEEKSEKIEDTLVKSSKRGRKKAK